MFYLDAMFVMLNPDTATHGLDAKPLRIYIICYVI